MTKAQTYTAFEKLYEDRIIEERTAMMELIKQLADFLNADEFEKFYDHARREILL
jgi:hypothetical protein